MVRVDGLFRPKGGSKSRQRSGSGKRGKRAKGQRQNRENRREAKNAPMFIDGDAGIENPVTLMRSFGLNTLNSDASGDFVETWTPNITDFPSWNNLVAVFDEFKVQALSYILVPIQGNNEDGIISFRATSDNSNAIEADIDSEVLNGAKLLNYADISAPSVLTINLKEDDQNIWHKMTTSPSYTNWGETYIRAKYLPVSTPVFMRYKAARISFRGLKT